jgi:hypothetical protein
MSTTIQTGRLPRRFRTPEFTDPIPDSLRLEDGTYITNPEWEAATYEEAFFDKHGNALPPMSTYEFFRWIQAHP